MLAVLLGVLAAAAGAGLGIRHLQKTGFTPSAGVGLALLAGGLLLLGLGCAALWRAGRGWRRLWFVPGTVVGLMVGWSVAIAVTATVVPATPGLPDTPVAHGLPAEQVEFPTSDGVRLSAWWVASANGSSVVLLHGAGENRAATLRQAAVLAGHGYGVLLVDARGHGRSGGRGMDLGWYGDADVRAALDYLSNRNDDDARRFAVLGLSMGGEEAIGAAAADPRIRAVVAEGATARTAADKAAWLPGGVTGAVQRAWDRLTFALVDLLTPASPPTALVDAVARSRPTRFLLVTAGTQPDEARAAAALRAAAPDRVTVWGVPGAGHTHALSAAPAEWERRVVGFLDAALAR